jgi:hypothetical protein
MIINYEGREWTFEASKIGVEEWRELKRKYKMTPKAFQEGLDEADPDVMTFAYWVLLRQNGGTTLPLGDQLKPDIIALNNAFGEAAQNEPDEPEPEPDPTKVSPSTPTSSDPASPTPASGPAAGGSLTG